MTTVPSTRACFHDPLAKSLAHASPKRQALMETRSPQANLTVGIGLGTGSEHTSIDLARSSLHYTFFTSAHTFSLRDLYYIRKRYTKYILKRSRNKLASRNYFTKPHTRFYKQWPGQQNPLFFGLGVPVVCFGPLGIPTMFTHTWQNMRGGEYSRVHLHWAWRA